MKYLALLAGLAALSALAWFYWPEISDALWPAYPPRNWEE